MVAIFMVVALHIFLLYGLKNGLARHALELITGPVEVKMIDETIPEDKEPPPPPPKLETPPPFVPPPELSIDIPADAPSNAIVAVQTTRPAAPPPMAPPAATRSPPRSDPRHPLAQPEYPPTARRLGQEGTVVLLIYVQPDGKVGDVKIHKSSGFDKLDEAAVREAKRSWRFIPAKEGNNPVAEWGQFAVTFRLTDQ
ncbi:MAG TPA: energy transducer TonB [Steroidobacteraceae bacterium]|nr:energy transducer TonB [Steroidobacteraceae bacterium]